MLACGVPEQAELTFFWSAIAGYICRIAEWSRDQGAAVGIFTHGRQEIPSQCNLGRSRESLITSIHSVVLKAPASFSGPVLTELGENREQ